MKPINLLIPILLVVLFSCSKKENSIEPKVENETMVDADGNVYNTIKIGNQTWMLENLKTTTFNDGTPITKYTFKTHGVNWHNLNKPETLYQWADASDLNNVHENELPFDYYGAMYNHLAIESGKLAPKGWRIPTEKDFKELENHLSENGYAGKEGISLKSSNGWMSLSGNGTDAVGFKGLPNGYIHASGGATFAEGICTWATTSVDTTNSTRKMIQLYNQDTILYADNAIQIGAGIRCIKE
jgi:uncharacterized protein (TIGR02145 family)